MSAWHGVPQGVWPGRKMDRIEPFAIQIKVKKRQDFVCFVDRHLLGARKRVGKKGAKLVQKWGRKVTKADQIGSKNRCKSGAGFWCGFGRPPGLFWLPGGVHFGSI